MRKKIFSMLALLGMMSAGVWAQTTVTAPKASTPEVQYRYTLHCKAADHNTYLGIVDDEFNGRSAVENATEFEFEATGVDGQFYLWSVKLGYVTANGGNITFTEEPSTYWTINAGDGWVYLLANGQNGVYLNNNKTTGDGIKTAAGTGDCSHWVLTEYATEAEPLAWSTVKDGYTYAIVNVQPAAAGKNYYLNSTDGNLTPVDATGFNSISKWPKSAQYVAEQQADGKFAFRNVENGQYLAYKSHNTGENGMKGFVDDLADWSKWTMNKSTRTGFEGTYYPVCQKRSSTNSTVSTLLIANDGTWNAWTAGECTNTGYSNNYGFVELAAPTGVKYNITFNFEGAATGTTSVEVASGSTPILPVAMPSYVSYTVSPALTAATADATYTVTTEYNATMPFQTSGDAYYTLKMNRDPALNIFTDGSAIRTVSNVSMSYDNQESFKWQFAGDWLNGFTLMNKAEGKYVTYGSANPANKYTATLTDTPDAGAYFDLIINGGKNYLKLHGTTSDAYVSNNGGPSTTFLTNWNSASNIGDAGAQILIAEAQDIAFDLTTAKSEAIASLPTNIPVLFTAEALSAATTAINDVTCGADEASINAALSAISEAKENYMKSAEAKFFSIKSTQGSRNYVDASGNAIDATSATLKATGVYELEYVEGTGQFMIHALKNDVYVMNNTSTNSPSVLTSDKAEAGVFYIGNVNGNENEIYMTKVLSGWNAIHYNSNYGGHNCVWSYDAGASQWTIEAVDEQAWQELNPSGCDWAAYEVLYNQVMAMQIGDALGQYADMAMEAYGDVIHISEAMGYFEADFEDKNEEYYDSDMEDMQWILDHAQINLPKPGSFLRIKGAATQKYISGNNGGVRVPLTDNADEAVLYLNEAGQLIGTICGRGLTDTHTYATGANIETQTFAEAPYAKGAYLIKSSYAGSKVFVDWTDDMLNRWSNENDVRSTWYIEEVNFLPVKVSAAGFASLYTPVALQVPTGVKAYALTENDDYLTATEVEGIIPANTGVILEAEPDTYKFYITTGGSAASCLGGTATPQAAPESVYTLGMADGIGFYKYTGAVASGFKAFYQKSSEAKGFSISFDDSETGITGLTGNADVKGQTIYNLAGQRLQKTEKGIYIINGKKVLK